MANQARPKIKLLSLFLCLAIVFSSLPFTAATASAEENADVETNTEKGVDPNDKSTPYLTFRVLDTDSGQNGFASSTNYDEDTLQNAMLLDCDSITTKTAFNAENKNGWVDGDGTTTQSDIRKNFIENGANQSSYGFKLSGEQYANIMASYKGVNQKSKVETRTDKLIGDKLFLLNYDEANGTYYNNNAGCIKKLDGAAGYWWLRSPSSNNDNNEWFVDDDGCMYYSNADNTSAGVSPALNLNLASVIFTSENQNISDFAEIKDASTDFGKSTDKAWIMGLQTTTTDMPTVTTGTNTFTVTATPTNYTNVAAMEINSSGEVVKFGKVNLNQEYSYTDGNCVRIFGYNDIDKYGTINTSAVKEIGTAVTATTTPSNIKKVNANLTINGKATIAGLNSISDGAVQSYVNFGQDFYKRKLTIGDTATGTTVTISKQWVYQTDSTTLTVKKEDDTAFDIAPEAKTTDGVPVALSTTDGGKTYTSNITNIPRDTKIEVYIPKVMTRSVNLAQKDEDDNITLPGVIGADISGSVSSYVNFGTNTSLGKPLVFRVLDTDSGKNGFASSTNYTGDKLQNAMLLDCDSITSTDKVKFSDLYGGWEQLDTTYKTNYIRKNFVSNTNDQSQYNDDGGKPSNYGFKLSEGQYNNILASYKAASTNDKVKSTNGTDKLLGDKLFVLSYDEVDGLDNGSGTYYKGNTNKGTEQRKKAGTAGNWWLRSPIF